MSDFLFTFSVLMLIRSLHFGLPRASLSLGRRGLDPEASTCFSAGGFG